MQTWFRWSLVILQISIMAQVFAIGLGASWDDATYLFRRPKLLWNSILARNVVLPILAVVLIKLFTFHLAIAITLGVLAVTPVPPLLPKSQLKAGARSEYVVGLLVSQALLAIVLVPVTIGLMNWALGSKAHFGSWQVAQMTVKAILIPLLAGMAVARFLPRVKKLTAPMVTVGTVMLIVGALPLLLIAWKAFGELAGDGAMLALAIFIVGGIAGGHLLGGPRAEDRTALAIATSWRHPGLAMAIATANFPEQKLLIAGAVVIYLVLRMILAIPYERWRHTTLRVPRHPAPLRAA